MAGKYGQLRISLHQVVYGPYLGADGVPVLVRIEHDELREDGPHGQVFDG